jgi:hypothetical protein
MASIPGGPADKLGNEFERLWLVRHAIEVIAGRAVEIQIESLGADELGVEFWVGRPNGEREGHQCKRENGSRGAWSIADLHEKQVIAKARLQLDRSPYHHFYFVSGDKSPTMADLSERAGRGDSDAVFNELAVTTSSKLKNEFAYLCRALSLNSADERDVARVRDFLRRFHVQIQDKSSIRPEVEALAARWITGEPAENVAALESSLSRNENFGRIIKDSEVIGFLPAGSRPRDLTKDVSLAEKVRAATARYERSYQHLLIGGKTLGRDETKLVIQSVFSSGAPRLIIVHGSGGTGKSGVMFELLRFCKSKNLPALAARLDRDNPGSTASQFGNQLGLPASPAACIAAVSAGCTGLLILDQIDAIRWTSAHSSHAWDTCECVITEALTYPNLRVVATCRSFDLRDDPRLKYWKENSLYAEVEVGELQDAVVDKWVATKLGKRSALGAAQRRVLRSPQSLYLWLTLFDGSAHPPPFRTLTDLMRLYWKRIRQQSIPASDRAACDQMLSSLVDHMDQRGILRAPSSLVSSWPIAESLLISLNVLVKGERTSQLSFAHQSLLDHLTAERILNDVLKGHGSVLAWLRNRDQSLFRRGQLRQLLTLLRDEDHAEYAETLSAFFTEPDIRFHLSHLALQILGSAPDPTSREVDLVLRLTKEDRWRNHVFSEVLFGKPVWFDALDDAAAINRWLAEGESLKSFAINLIAVMIDKRCARAEKLIKANISKGSETYTTLLSRASPEVLSAEFFLDYVEIARTRARFDDFTEWSRLAERNAARFLQLIKARVEYLLCCDEGAITMHENPLARIPLSLRETLDVICTASAAAPQIARELFVPVMKDVNQRLRKLRGKLRKGFTGAVYENKKALHRVERILRRGLIAAGKAIASTPGNFLLHQASRKGFGCEKSVDYINASVLLALSETAADKAMDWLLEDSRRFACGLARRSSRYQAGRYLPARRIFRRFASACSERAFREIESKIRSFRPTHELDHYRFVHHYVMETTGNRFIGSYQRHLFLGQFMLLSALPKRRLLPETVDWLGVLRRKFGSPRSLLRESSTSFGGFVTSTIPPERLHRLTEKHWLAIVGRDWSAKAHKVRQLGPDMIAEVRPELFARDFGVMCRVEPSRFADLAITLPENVGDAYLDQILMAFSASKAPDNSKSPMLWEPASSREIEAVLERFFPRLSKREFAMRVCWILHERPDDAWSPSTLSFLANVAIHHSHPAADEVSVFTDAKQSEASLSKYAADVQTMSLNCVRGTAAMAITRLLQADPTRLAGFDTAIRALISDQHPAVRCAAIGLAIPMLHGDRRRAVREFLAACAHEDIAVLHSHAVSHFLSYTLLADFADLLPLLERMVAAPLKEVAEKGAAWITLAWIHKGYCGERVATLAKADVSHRKGVAEALAQQLPRVKCRSEEFDLLESLLNDENDGVRTAASNVFGQADVFKSEAAVEIAKSFVTSRAAHPNLVHFLMGLKAYRGSIIAFADSILTITEVFSLSASRSADGAALLRPWDSTTYAEILLRLYEQAEDDRPLRNRCLNAWDWMLEHRIGYDVLNHLDK